MEIRTVGVLGAGQMGLGIAQAAARAGFDTIMAKATPGGLDAQRGRVEKQLQKEVERGKLTAADHGALLERLRWTTHLHDLANTDLVIESVVEELPVKRDFFGRLDDVVKDDAIFATNTSTLTVGDLASATRRPERFVGLHFFNPVHAMKLVEVAPSLRTTPETVEACIGFAERLGKTPVVVADSTGYIVNRLLVPYMVDAVACLERGLGSIADIDTAMQNGANHPMGPLALADFIGLDIVFRMASLLHEEYKEPRFAPPPLLRRMVLAGYLGRKSGKGFYDYASSPAVPHDALVARPGVGASPRST
jgi:3-hydroxybutyryl-CoA dehydrogenase